MKYAPLTSFLALAIFAFGAHDSKAQVVPVALDNSDFSVDAIWEKGGSYGADLSGDPTATTSYVLVTDGAAATTAGALDPVGDLPDDGVITTSGAVFQLQPYDENNVFVLDKSAGTITLAPSAQSSYTKISFLVSTITGRHNAAVSFTLNYTNGPSIALTETPTVPVITSSPGNDGIAAIALGSYLSGGMAEPDSAPLYLDEYDFQVSAPPSEILQSVTIDPGIDQFQLYAISGVDPVSVPEPSTWALMLTTLSVGLGLRAGGIGRSARASR